MRRNTIWVGVALVVGSAGAYLARPALEVPVATPARARQRADDAQPESRSPRRRTVPRQALAREASDTSLVLAGRVQTERGEAIAAARVCAFEANAVCCRAPACAQSDARGEFRLSLAEGYSATLFASHPHYAPATASGAAGQVGPFVLTLKGGGAMLTGSVLDAAGGPIAGAELSITDLDDRPLALAVSEADGRFAVRVAFGTTRILARADGYSEERRGVEAPVAGIEIRLSAATALAGRVLSEGTEEGVGGVLVTARADEPLPVERSMRSLADGTFRLSSLRPGRYSLRALGASWRSDPQWIEIESGAPAGPVDVVVKAASEVSGSVELGGTPCPLGWATLGGRVERYAAAGSDGRVVFEGVTAGRYELVVACGGARQHETIDVDTEPVRRVWDLAPGARLNGVVLGASGTPVAATRVEVLPVAETEAAADAITDDKGEFRCAGLSAGDYDVGLGGTPARAARVRVHMTANGSARVELRTVAEGAIEVRIAPADAIDPATLSVVARRPSAAALVGQRQGDVFVFAPLALGRYELGVDSDSGSDSDSDSGGTRQLVELTRDGQLAQITLAVPETHTLRGLVVDGAGQAVPGIWVRALHEQTFSIAAPAEPVLSDDDGAFMLSGLVPGRYTLEAGGPAERGRQRGVASNGARAIVQLSAVEAPLTWPGEALAAPSAPAQGRAESTAL